MRMIYWAGKLYPGTGKAVYQEWAISVLGGRIEAVGPGRELAERYPDAEIVQRPDWLLLPGLTDAHDHGRALSPLAFGVEDRCLELWIPGLGAIPPVSPYLLALYDGLELATSGVTSVVHCHNAGSWEGIEQELVDTAKGYAAAGVRAVLCPPYIDQNALIYDDRDRFIEGLPDNLQTEFRGMLCDQPYSLDHYLEMVDRLLERLRSEVGRSMTEIQLHPVAGQWCSDESLVRIQEFAESRNLRIHMHLLETKYHRIYARKKWGEIGTIRHLHDLGFLDSRLSCAHMVWVEERELELLRQAGTAVVTNPSSNLRLKSGVAPLSALLAAGIPCALGLDGCAFDDDHDFLREMRVAGYNPRETGVGGGIDSARILEMACAGGAAVTGGGLSGGQLAPGLPADFVCVDYKALEYPYADPGLDPAALLLARGTARVVEAVFVGGEPVVEDRRTRRANIADVAEELRMAITQAVERQEHRAPSREILSAIEAFYENWEQEERLGDR